MIYVINKKAYIKVSGYFKEVKIRKKSNDYIVSVVKDSQPILAYGKNIDGVSKEQAYEMTMFTKTIEKEKYELD